MYLKWNSQRGGHFRIKKRTQCSLGAQQYNVINMFEALASTPRTKTSVSGRIFLNVPIVLFPYFVFNSRGNYERYYVFQVLRFPSPEQANTNRVLFKQTRH